MGFLAQDNLFVVVVVDEESPLGCLLPADVQICYKRLPLFSISVPVVVVLFITPTIPYIAAFHRQINGS